MRKIVEGGMKRGRWVEGASNTFSKTSGLFVTSSSASLYLNFTLIVYLLLSPICLAPLSSVVPYSPLPSVLSRVPPTASSSNLTLEATTGYHSLTLWGGTTHTRTTNSNYIMVYGQHNLFRSIFYNEYQM